MLQTAHQQGETASSGWKVGVTRDLINLFNEYDPDTWFSQSDLHRKLGSDWAPETIANAVNKLARDGFVTRLGDRGDFRYARLASAENPGTMKAGDDRS